MNSTITVHVLFQAIAGQENKVQELLLSVLAPTRAEKGCLNYDLHLDPKDPTRFMLYENWATQADLDQHSASAHLQKFREQMKPLLARPPELTHWKKI